MRSRVTGPFAATLSGVATDVETALRAVQADNIVATEFQDMSSANINSSGGAFVAFGSGAALPAAVKSIQLTYTAGEPLAFRVAASAVAAAALSVDNFVINQGEGPLMINILMNSGDKVWVRSKSANAVSAGYLTANFGG